MSLQFAILTALVERPSSTGLELTRRFDRSIAYFWPASHQQIYRELDRLRALGFAEELAGPARPQRGQPRRFAATDAGVKALSQWLHGVEDPAPPRESIVVRVRAAAALGDVAGVRAAVEHHLQHHLATLENYRTIDARDFATTSQDSDVLRHVVLQAGLTVEAAWVTWCQVTLAALQQLEAHRPGAVH